MNELVMTGLDGANPLGFLAALGVLEAVHAHGAHGQDARLHFRNDGGWRPILTEFDGDLDELIDWLDQDRASCMKEPALDLQYDGKRDLKPRPDKFRDYLEQLVEGADIKRRRGVDWASCFATDVAVDNKGKTKPTALHFAAGQQQFLKMTAELMEKTTPERFGEALIGPWRYDSKLAVMGWDATSCRDYALRASDPSKEKLGVPGADWLALRGLTFFPAFPVKTRVLTTGCEGRWKSGRFRWGVWTVPLSRDVIRAVVPLDLVGMGRQERDARGFGAVFSCGIKRSDQGGYGSFEPATVV